MTEIYYVLEILTTMRSCENSTSAGALSRVSSRALTEDERAGTDVHAYRREHLVDESITEFEDTKKLRELFTGEFGTGGTHKPRPTDRRALSLN